VEEVDISDRKLKILSVIVKKYIENGIPVSSKAVCSGLDFPISSATVRSEMSDLYRFGYLIQPHTSSGRIPSNKGYRLYVSKFISKESISSEEKNIIEGALYSHSDDPENLIEKACQILSKMTSFVSVFTTPPSSEAKVRNIQFVKTGKRNAMIVLMTTTGMIKNKLFRCQYDVNPDLINVFSNLLNEKFQGKPLQSITPESVGMISDSNNSISMLLSPIINALIDASLEAQQVSIKIEGQTNLFSVPEIDIDDTIRLLNLLSDKNNVLSIISSMDKNLCIKIGEENDHQELKKLSIIIRKYIIGDKLGSIILIGPTRMNYSELICKIDSIATSVEKLLNQILDI
jgi:heat-inducible transcriptional repressor